MNLLSLILIVMALIVGACVFYVAWELSSGAFESAAQKRALDGRKNTPDAQGEEEPDESRES